MARESVMEIRNGYIVGIFNYCDRWCDACAFTSRCRLFADGAEIEASLERALHGLAEDQPEDRDWPADYDGSAKVALLGIDRSHAAWLELIERRVVTDAEAAPFIADLVWLGEALERVFPAARAFVRPALDEPEEVSKLLARERS